MVSATTTNQKYQVHLFPSNLIKPSPENDLIYGEVQDDDQMNSLVNSIDRRGLEEPILISRDRFIISGHRRFQACKRLAWEFIPVRVKQFNRKERLSDWPRLLTEYNPQRIKTAGTLLREALIRSSTEDSRDLLARSRDHSTKQISATFLPVNRDKEVKPITKAKKPFLDATIKVVEKLHNFWPLTVRLIHYQLLNDPPLIAQYARSSRDTESQRYRNDERSYKALGKLLKQARYHGHVSMDAIDDPTRPMSGNDGWKDLGDFIRQETDGFLFGYRRHLQDDQPRHIEVLGEKNTLLNVLGPICREYCVPMALGRGYCSTPVWRDIARRFSRSGKSRMTLIVASDFDPEGLDLAEDAIASLCDLWGTPVDYHRVGVTRQQIDDQGLAEDFNPAKSTSPRYKRFVRDTGSDRSWELEALSPEYLQQELRSAIEANMDMDLYQAAVEKEESEAEELAEIRRELIAELDI